MHHGRLTYKIFQNDKAVNGPWTRSITEICKCISALEHYKNERVISIRLAKKTLLESYEVAW